MLFRYIKLLYSLIILSLVGCTTVGYNHSPAILDEGESECGFGANVILPISFSKYGNYFENYSLLYYYYRYGFSSIADVSARVIGTFPLIAARIDLDIAILKDPFLITAAISTSVGAYWYPNLLTGESGLGLHHEISGALLLGSKSIWGGIVIAVTDPFDKNLMLILPGILLGTSFEYIKVNIIPEIDVFLSPEDLREDYPICLTIGIGLNWNCQNYIDRKTNYSP